MNVLEKVARLERLLAKVRQNGVRRAAAGGTEGEVQLVVRDEPTRGGAGLTPEPVLRAVESRARLARFLEEDRWEPDEPAKVAAPPRPHVDTLPPPYEVPRPAPLPSDDWASATVLPDTLTEARREELREEVGVGPEEADDEIPQGLLDLEKAVLLAVRKSSSPSPRDPATFWTDAAAELAPRASSAPPPPPNARVRELAPPPPRSRPPATYPPDSELPTSVDARSRRRRFRTLPPRRRPPKPPSMVVKIHGGLAAVGVIGVVAVIWVILRSPPSTGALEYPAPLRSEVVRAEPAQSEPALTGAVASVSEPPPPAAPIPAPTPRAGPSPELDAAAVASDQALLRVQTEQPRYVFVNGRKVGESGAWLHVPCGWRHVRLADRGPTPPGESFPKWSHEGHSVLIPCGEATEVSLADSD